MILNFPAGPVGKTSSLIQGGPGFDPWSGKKIQDATKSPIVTAKILSAAIKTQHSQKKKKECDLIWEKGLSSFIQVKIRSLG